jgi:hypothetical protein
MTVRKYISTSQETTLTVALTSNATTMTVISAAGLLGTLTPAVGETFTVVIDPDTSQEEIVDVISPSAPGSNTLTITRGVGVDGTTAIAHSVGAKVRHMATGRDFREANLHIENSTTAHGLTIANVLETSDTNMITNAMLQANSVTTAKITDLNVTTGKIADSAITSAKIADLGIATGDIADLAITTGKVADAAITSAKIADLTIATGDIADSAITSAKIADGTIVAGDIADGAITSGKILNDTIVNADINSAAAIAYSKLNLAGSVTSADITDGTIVNGDISPSAAIAYSKLNLAGSVTSSDIVDGTIVNADLSTSAQVAYSKLNLTNTIVNADINASAAIEKTKISGTAITAADTGTVTSTMIADGAITNADINAAAAIALSKLATDPLARANHTGTQTASTVSDFDTQVRTSRLDQMAAPTGSVSANSQKITNLATPTSNTDAATKAYADLMIPLTQKGAANGVAELDADGLLPANRLPSLSITTTQVVATQAAMLALTAQTGDVAVRTDLNKTFILTASPATTLANWQELLTPTDAVLSVDGQTGTVSLSSTYATVANAANKLPLAGGTMSGAIVMGSNKITGLGTPTTTGDAATKDYADTKLALTGGTLSGALAMGTNKITGVGDPTNAQDAATKNYIDNVVLAPSNLIGVITSVGNATSIASQTGTGTKFVVDTSPTLVTPILGVATATSINGTTIPASKTLVATDSTVYVVPSQGGNSGKFLTTDGTTSTWGTVAGYNAPTLGSTSIASGATVANVNGLTINSTTIPTSKTLVTTDTTAYVSTAGGSTVTASAAGVIPLVLKGTSSQTADLFQVQDSSTNKHLAIGYDGNVTLGGIPGSYALLIAKPAPDVNIFATTGTNIARLGLRNTSGSFELVIDNSIGNLYGLGNYSRIISNTGAYPTIFTTNSLERMRIDSAGRIGIGSTPAGVDGIFNVNINGTTLHLGYGTNFDNYFTAGTNGIQVFRTAGTERVRIDSSGNVGIGTASPAASTRLTLSDTNSAKLALTGGSTQNGILLNAVSTSNQYYVGAGINLLVGGDKGFLIYNTATATAKFFANDITGETRVLGTTFLTNYTSGVERMRIDAAGNASFTGTIAPGMIIGKTNTGGTILGSNDSGSISVRGDATTQAAAMSFHRAGNYAINMGLDTDNNFKIGGWSAGIIMMTLTPAGNLTVPGTVTAPTFAGNATTAYGLNVHAGRNNEANKVVRTDGSGYLQTGYINSENGNEGNNSNPPRVWGTNGGDNYLRTYLTSALNVNSATILNSSHYIQKVGTSGNLNTDFQNTPAGTFRYNGDFNGGTNSLGGWWIYENKRHDNASNYWGTQVAWGWEDNANRLATRNVSANSFGAWVHYINSSNHNTYGLRNIQSSTSGPSGGSDGDVWIQYT